MNIAFLSVAIVIAIALFYLLRSTPKTATAPVGSPGRVRGAKTAASRKPAAEHRPFRSISIKCGPGACEEALALGQRRFLAGRVGKLPLAGCTSTNCNCKFVHHPDRRDSDGDKRAPTALRSELYTASGNSERRTRSGRRKGDFK